MRVGEQVRLLEQIGALLSACVVPEERQWHDQREKTLPVVVNRRRDLGPVGGIELVGHVARHVLQDVRVSLGRWRTLHHYGEFVEVGMSQLRYRVGFPRGPEQRAHASHSCLVSGHAQVLVRGVKLHQAGACKPHIFYVFPTPHGKDARDEVFSQPRVVESTFLFDRQVRRPPQQYLRKDPGAISRRHAVGIVHFDALHAAAR